MPPKRLIIVGIRHQHAAYGNPAQNVAHPVTWDAHPTETRSARDERATGVRTQSRDNRRDQRADRT